MEIERKFLVAQLPDNLDNYNCRYIEQGYLSTKPVVRVRRWHVKNTIFHSPKTRMNI